MPTSFNINPPIAGININIRSVSCWFWPSTTDQGAEVVPTASRFVVYEGFTQNNLGGVSVGKGSVDTGGQTALQMYQSSTVQQLLTAAFGP